MTCGERVAELVECARRAEEPGPDLREHLAACAHCSERWEAERQLTAQFHTIRMRAGVVQFPGPRREALMQEFSRRHRVPGSRRLASRPLVWALTAAAALAAAVLAGHELGVRARRAPTPPRAVRTGDAVMYEVSNDASALSSDDFIAVPYTPPLAPGEMVRVVHTELYPQAFANMGFDVRAVWRDQDWASRLPADVVVGGDGIPRAVRFTGSGTPVF